MCAYTYTQVCTGQLLTSVLLNFGSLSEHQPVQPLQNLQFYFFEDCKREYMYSRISLNSQQIVGNTVAIATEVADHNIWSKTFHVCLHFQVCMGQLLTSVFLNFGSLSKHQPVQPLQNLQFYFFEDCKREYMYSRISVSSQRIARHSVCYSLQFYQ